MGIEAWYRQFFKKRGSQAANSCASAFLRIDGLNEGFDADTRGAADQQYPTRACAVVLGCLFVFRLESVLII